jgi:2-phosphosulfolactate phosphatase
VISTFRRWQDVPPNELRDHCAIVIDVLRWSSVVITALENGAVGVEAFAAPEEVLRRAAALGRHAVLLGGERGSVALPGFDVGNSPLEYGHERVQGRVVLTTTTNGTQGLVAAREATTVLVGAFVNLPSLVARAARELHEGRPLALIACGQAGEVAEEDVACAGAIATALGANVMDGTTEQACGVWARAGRRAEAVMRSAPHAATLRAAGFGDDLRYSASTGSLRCVPRLDGSGRLVAAD